MEVAPCLFLILGIQEYEIRAVFAKKNLYLARVMV